MRKCGIKKRQIILSCIYDYMKSGKVMCKIEILYFRKGGRRGLSVAVPRVVILK